MIRRILSIFRRRPEPEPVEDFRDVLEDMWVNREAIKAEETKRKIQFDLET